MQKSPLHSCMQALHPPVSSMLLTELADRMILPVLFKLLSEVAVSSKPSCRAS